MATVRTGRTGALESVSGGKRNERNTVVFKSLSNSLILRGILAFVIGILALAWPRITVFALVILFAVFAFTSAGLQGMRAFSSAKAGPIIGHLLLGLVDIAAGVVALVWPGLTALVLVVIVGIWAIAGGLVECFTAFRRGETAGQRALSFIGGLVSVFFGVILVAHPAIGAVTLALLFGLLLLILGAWQFVAGIEMRRTGKAIQSFPGTGTGPQPARQRGPSAAAEPTGAGTDASLPQPREPEAEQPSRPTRGRSSDHRPR
jgi:uncharacterized membrane protein HdeD (DUF308 family)